MAFRAALAGTEEMAAWAAMRRAAESLFRTPQSHSCSQLCPIARPIQDWAAWRDLVPQEEAAGRAAMAIRRDSLARRARTAAPAWAASRAAARAAGFWRPA